jgi:hypothetical protein
MIVIVESGATKCDWCAVSPGGDALNVRTDGMNLATMTVPAVEEVVREAVTSFERLSRREGFRGEVTEVHFYAAGLIVPEDGTSFEVGATAIFKGAAHPNAAKLWIEYALSPDCVDIAKENGSYQFLVLSNATQPEEAAEFGLDMNNTIDYDFEDAKMNTAQYVEDFFAALEGTDESRFLTE